MSEYQHQQGIGSRPGSRATAWLLGAILAATVGLCGWNIQWSSGGPTSVTIVGLNGPNENTSNPPESDDAAVLAATQLVDSR